MNVVDSSAWLWYFAGDRNAAAFAAAVENFEKLLVPSIAITEVFNNILRQCNEESALTAIAHLKQRKVIPLDSELAIDADNYGVVHKLPLADSIIFATAQKYNAPLSGLRMSISKDCQTLSTSPLKVRNKPHS